MAHDTAAHKTDVSAQPATRAVRSAIVIGGAVVGTAMLLGASVLWVHYGSTVFFETIASGLAACF